MAEERYDIYSRGSSGWAISMRTEEFQEDDVWAVFKERKDFNSSASAGYNSSNVSPRPLPSAARMIPRPGNYNSTGNSSVDDQPKWVQQSAPVNIPDWSKIYGKHNSKKAAAAASYRNSAWLDHYDDAEDGNYARRGSSISDNSDEDDEDDSNSMMIPPHEWIAKKLARSRISSFSVCEGVGRTLKGRDLSRVRNAVLSRTGFLE